VLLRSSAGPSRMLESDDHVRAAWSIRSVSEAFMEATATTVSMESRNERSGTRHSVSRREAATHQARWWISASSGSCPSPLVLKRAVPAGAGGRATSNPPKSTAKPQGAPGPPYQELSAGSSCCQGIRDSASLFLPSMSRELATVRSLVPWQARSGPRADCGGS
jgi:hypothetical protein